MTPIEVQSVFRNYKILVGRNLIERTVDHFASLSLRGKVMIVTQKAVASKYLPVIKKSLSQKFEVHVHYVQDGEKAKSQTELNKLYKILMEERFERKDVILALGGGVVGDLAGFAAATFLRGLPFVNIPTTLLAQVDSSIGGKTGINMPEGKNLLGAFYPPCLVICDSQVLKTLPDAEYRSAMGEIVKYGLIREQGIFQLLEKKTDKILKRDPLILEELVTGSAQIKAEVVSADEFERKGERMILNLGHTFGHAFEQVLNYEKLRHGEAVGLGILAVTRVSEKMGLITALEKKRIFQVVQNLKLPMSLKPYRLSVPKMMAAMQRDKKKNDGKLRFVLPQGIGRVMVREDVDPNHVSQVLRELGGLSA